MSNIETDPTKRTEDYTYGSKVLAEQLVNEGVTDIFCVPGGNDLVMEEGAALGITSYVVRHEQTAGYAADAYARCLKKPGVVSTSTSPGAANVVPAMFHAKGCSSPVVLLAGTGGSITAGINNSQQMTPSPAVLMKDICKMSEVIPDIRVAGYWIRKGFREAMNPVQGPVTLEIPAPLTYAQDNLRQFRYVDKADVAVTASTAGDPYYVKKAAELIVNAKCPVIIAGDGLYWSDGASALIEFAEFVQAPTSTKRTARGAMPEDHYLAFGGAHRAILKNADVICLIGHQVTAMDEWFQAPDWPQTAKYIQIQETANEIFHGMPSDLKIVGNSRIVLQQLLEFAKDMVNGPIDRSELVNGLSQMKQKTAYGLAKMNELYKNRTPMHTNSVCQAVGDILDDSSTLIFDSFSASSFITTKVTAKYAGQILDAGMFQTLGHSIGMCMGAQIARPGRQVLTVIGDGGFGISGMDMETLARYNLPAVVVLINNSSWGGRAWGAPQYYPKKCSQNMLPNMRYDKAFAEFGCHTEYVTEDAQLRPALERAFNSGKPALINCIADTDVTHPYRARVNILDTWIKRSACELPDEARAELRSMTPGTLVRAQKYAYDTYGIEISIDELAKVCDIELNK